MKTLWKKMPCRKKKTTSLSDQNIDIVYLNDVKQWKQKAVQPPSASEMEKKLQKQIHAATEEEKSIRGGSVRCMNDYWGAEVQYRASFMTVMWQLTWQPAVMSLQGIFYHMKEEVNTGLNMLLTGGVFSLVINYVRLPCWRFLRDL